VLEYLLEMGTTSTENSANVKWGNYNWFTALMGASQSSSVSKVRKQHCNQSVPNRIVAFFNEHSTCGTCTTTTLMHFHFSWFFGSFCNLFGFSFWSFASRLGTLNRCSLPQVRLLLDKGADPFAVCHNGQSAIHFAMASQKTDAPRVVELLMHELGAEYVTHYREPITGYTLLHRR